MEREELEAMLGRGMSLSEIGEAVGLHAMTVSYWLRKHGLRPVYAERHAARGGLARGELESMVAEGLSVTEIAARVDRSKTTVRYWLRRHGLSTRRMRNDAAQAAAGDAPALELTCARHGSTLFVREGDGYLRCRRCRSESVSAHRRRLKRQLVAEGGGRCLICGYAGSMRALEFHHLDPAQKTLTFAAHGVTLALERLREEARKCVLLCSNCHAEVEDGSLKLPLEFADDTSRGRRTAGTAEGAHESPDLG